MKMQEMPTKEIKEYILANYFDGEENVDSVVSGDDEIITMANTVKALEKLAEYEELEEQGRLIKLPRKIGDKVYPLSYGCGYQEQKIISVNYYAEAGCQSCEFEIESDDHEEYDTFELDDIGIRVFFDKDERDRKLDEDIQQEVEAFEKENTNNEKM